MKQIQDLRIISFDNIERIKPNTNNILYCEYVRIRVNFDNGSNKYINISDWYTSKEIQVQELKQEMSQLLHIGYYVIINQDTIDNFLNILKS